MIWLAYYIPLLIWIGLWSKESLLMSNLLLHTKHWHGIRIEQIEQINIACIKLGLFNKLNELDEVIIIDTMILECNYEATLEKRVKRRI